MCQACHKIILINQSINQKRISERYYCLPGRLQGRCHAIDAMLKILKMMTSGDRRRTNVGTIPILVFVGFAASFSLTHS